MSPLKHSFKLSNFHDVDWISNYPIEQHDNDRKQEIYLLKSPGLACDKSL